MRKKNEEIICDVVEKIGVLSTTDADWTKELRRVSWNGGDPKFDIRTWKPGDERYTKGITLHEDEARELAALLTKYFEEEDK